jgi:PhnB protein
MSLITYLFFNGNCEEAMNFYATAVSNSSIQYMQRYGEADMPVDDAYKNKVMHGVMTIHGTTVMVSDTNEKNQVTIGNNFSLSIDFKEEGEMEAIFNALGDGGKVTMPLQDTFWGARFGMCTDKFDVNWMFNHDKK